MQARVRKADMNCGYINIFLYLLFLIIFYASDVTRHIQGTIYVCSYLLKKKLVCSQNIWIDKFMALIITWWFIHQGNVLNILQIYMIVLKFEYILLYAIKFTLLMSIFMINFFIANQMTIASKINILSNIEHIICY